MSSATAEVALPEKSPNGSAGTEGARGPAGTDVLDIIVTPSPVGNILPATDGSKVPSSKPGGALDLRRTKDPITPS